MSGDLLLPGGTRLVHIGPQKTGTTSIQVAMAAARDVMATHGAYYPAGDHRRRKAGWALGLPGGPRDTPIRHWEELVAEVRAAGDLRVCVSDENFARAEAPIAERIVEDLGGERVHVVAVARRLDRFLPSQWQERVKAGVPASYETWLERVLGDDPADWERWNVWQGHDVGGLVDRWVPLVGPDRFTLVVADESDRAQLPRVFEAMLGLPEDTLRPNPHQSNVSLSWSELELVRALNDVYSDEGWSRAERVRLFRAMVRALRASPQQALGPRTAPLPAWALERVRALSDARVERVEHLPVRVVGDPEVLRVPDQPSAGADVHAEDLALPVGLAAAAVEGAVRAERKRGEEVVRRMAADPARRPVADLSGRELLNLASKRLARRFRGA